MSDYIYDCETFPNCFQINIEDAKDGTRWAYEISDRANHSAQIVHMLEVMRDSGARMVGFNNIGFDYPIIHMLYVMKQATAKQLYDKAMAIIDGDSWTHWVKPSDRIVEQLDLYKIHHFDNRARSTSLKVLEFNMRMDNVEDLPFDVGINLTPDQMDVLCSYCWNDIEATKAFYDETRPMIEFREVLTRKYHRNFMNHNDTKIGKDFFIMELEKAGVDCYTFDQDGRQPKQTPRGNVALIDVVFPWIEFENEKFKELLQWFKRQVVRGDDLKKALTKKLRVFDIELSFGLGGIHASVESEVIESNDTHVIIDLDVTSYYPSVAIRYRFYPEHLSPVFCDRYGDLKVQRVAYEKGTPENAMLKLALNGVFGDSNSVYGPFFDPLYFMKTTVNGQLLQCLLVEKLMAIRGVRLLQMNTDGLTIHVARDKAAQVEFVKEWWEMVTGLQLEKAEYSRMFIRDVNNYIAEYL